MRECADCLWDGDVPAVDAATADEMRSNLLPPYDKDAINPRDIYDIDSLLSAEDWAALDVKQFLRMAKDPAVLASEGSVYVYAVGTVSNDASCAA